MMNLVLAFVVTWRGAIMRKLLVFSVNKMKILWTLQHLPWTAYNSQCNRSWRVWRSAQRET